MTGHCGETAEIGHLAVRTGARWACGRDGWLEAIASAAAIGGLSHAGEGLLDPLRVALRQRTPVVHPADVTASALGDGGGVIGAALPARDGWAPES